MGVWPFGKRREAQKALSSVPAGRGGWMPIFESFAGAWQSNVVVDAEGVLANPFIFRCQAMISRDIAKLRVMLMQRQGDIWKETSSAAFSPVLRKPNNYQTRNQFWECYFLSKLARGNTYALKQRDARRVVTQMHVLDPTRVTPLVSDGGEVFYRLSSDNLAGLEDDVVVPASEVIHDRWNCLFHPLVGLSPIFANGIAATQAQKISDTSTRFFANQSRPGGILTAPGKISEDAAARLKTAFDANYTGDNSGKIAVMGDGLKFEAMAVNATDAQLVEQLKWTSETIATTYGIPLYKVGLGTMPTANNLQALNVEYYGQSLQGLIEDAESCLDDGLGLDSETIGTRFDIDGLLRMDSATQMDVLERSKSILTLDERRAKLNAAGITGGATVYLQEQDHSIEAIAARDKLLIEGSAETLAPTPAPADPEADEAQERAFLAETLLSMRKEMDLA